MDFAVKGTVLPVLEASLQPNEGLLTTHGDLGWMSPTIQLSQPTGGKGFFSAAKRMVGPGTVVFPAKLPGNIFSVEVAPNRSYYVHRSGFLCGTEGIEPSVAMQQKKMVGGFFGGMGFFLQHLQGQGIAWLELSGEMFAYDLPPGQSLRVHPNHVGAFEEGVQFSVGTIPGIANKMFGGNGFFVATLTGPGKVWLQSMSITQLAVEIADHLPNNGNAAAAGVTGGILGAMLKS